MKVNGEHAAIICPPLVHRLRVNILAAVNEAPMSPSEFVDAGLVPAEMVRSYDQVLSLTAYHFKQLMKAGCLEVIEVIPRRGARENIYAGWSQKRVSEDERRALPSADRVEISRLAVQGLIARADLSMQAETFDQRLDRHLTWRSLTLDEKGWEKLQAILLRTQREIDALRGGTEDLADSAGGQRINATVGLLGFESPPPLRDRGRAD
jgi:hypothetical protein